MKYYIDTEFLEGTQDIRVPFLGSYGKTKPTIDLISIGIVAEDNREFYAISKEFNIHEAWNRFQYKKLTNIERRDGFKPQKEYWIREHVLKTIFIDLLDKEEGFISASKSEEAMEDYVDEKFTYRKFKSLIKKYGQTREEIAEGIKYFTYRNVAVIPDIELNNTVEFYAYYADYDWVVFCWLFGNMINLPKGFPMYCNDLKQIMAEKELAIQEMSPTYNIKKTRKYPKQRNEHNALDDARWNKKLHIYLNAVYVPTVTSRHYEALILDFATNIEDKLLKKKYYTHFNIKSNRG